MFPRKFQRFIQFALTLASTALIAACGGGGGAGELGSGGTGVGTVTGFGSIYVDGARFDDSNATVQSDNESAPDQAPLLAEAKLGQRVEIEFEPDGVARTVNVQATLVGAVTARPNGNLTVLGQTVLVNTDATAGPVTQLSPYTTAAAIAVADIVEVHGVPLRQGNSGFVVQATRIEKRAALPQFLRVSGVVEGLTGSGSGAQFTVGALTVKMQIAGIVPPLRTLANGQSVVVWGTAANLDDRVAASPVLSASLVRIRDRIASPQRGYLGGLVTGLTGSRFNIGNATVDFSGATVTPSQAALSDGKYVQVRGNFGSDGVLVADEVKVRDGSADGDLRGTVTNYSAADGSFRIRDVGVTPAPGVVPQDCGIGLANGRFVEVRGNLAPGGIIAQTIRCASGDPRGAIIERRGAASLVQPLLRRFTLTPAGATPLLVRWKLLTFFRDGLTPQTLEGANLRVEGVIADDGALDATKISLDN